MTLVKDVEAIFRRRQYDAAPQSQIRQNKVVICNNNIGLFQSFSRFKKGALADMGATTPRALVLIG